MTYDELLTIAQQLTAQEKLRLAQSLTQLACNDQREQNPSHSAENSLPEKSGDDPCFRNSHTMPIKVIDQNRPWVGNEYALRRIFVVGESYTGTYENELEYDDAYIAAWLAGKKVPGPDLFKKMAVKLELSEQALWQQVAFTNMALGSIGMTTATKVTPAQLRAGQPRLESLFHRHEPLGVLILGVKTGNAVAPICKRLGIAYRTVYHPSGVNNANPRTACTADMLQSAWRDLSFLHARSAA